MALPDRSPTLESLELLVTIAGVGSIGRATARLGVTQPAASARIRALENDASGWRCSNGTRRDRS